MSNKKKTVFILYHLSISTGHRTRNINTFQSNNKSYNYLFFLDLEPSRILTLGRLRIRYNLRQTLRIVIPTDGCLSDKTSILIERTSPTQIHDRVVVSNSDQIEAIACKQKMLNSTVDVMTSAFVNK